MPSIRYSLSENRLLFFAGPEMPANESGEKRAKEVADKQGVNPEVMGKQRTEKLAKNQAAEKSARAEDEAQVQSLERQMNDSVEDNTIRIDDLQTRRGDVVIQYPDGTRAVFQRMVVGGQEEWEKQGPGRAIILSNRQDIENYARESNARFRFTP
jgi:xanthine dehydrogenase molybdopterin-binding subunit B